jgi:hypothetical protein
VIVAGHDPYAHRGYTDIAKPLLRRDGRSGCIDWTTKETKLYADELVAADDHDHPV